MVPVVSRLSLTPVKALALHHPDEVVVEPHGITTNQRFYLVAEDGRVANGNFHGPLVRLWADWDEPADRLTIRFPEGHEISGVVEVDGAVETDFFGLHVVEGRVVVGPWAEALSDWIGKPVRLVKADRPGDG